MIDIESLVNNKLPKTGFRKKYLKRPLIRFLRYIFHEEAFQTFAKAYPHIKGFDFVEKTLEYFNFKLFSADFDLEHIPTKGKLVIVANHPIGSLDGLALLKLVHSIRPDVKIVANEVLMALKPLQSLLLPVDNMGSSSTKENIQEIRNFLEQDGAIIIFPSGVVSRFSWKGIRDKTWNTGFLRFAKTAKAPILPIHVEARCSTAFYLISLIARPISTLWLVHEMFKQSNRHATAHIGELIPYTEISSLGLPNQQLANRLYQHTYRLPKGKASLFKTEGGIAPAQRRFCLRDELHREAERLGETADGKEIFLYRYQDDSTIMRELGRIREITFRSVGEGTGRRRDIDKYDVNYMHLILWDDSDLEIVGAYRICDTKYLLETTGIEGMYSSTLFEYQQAMQPYFEHGLELGRSFVQPKYWGRRSLDYLWYGIGALCRSKPEYRYLFGAVSVSNSFPDEAKQMMAHFYATHFPHSQQLCIAKEPYHVNENRKTELNRLFPGTDYKTEFATLKTKMGELNCAIPTLYKQYSELCEPGGVTFSEFGLDLDFSSALDAMVMVDTYRLRPAKRQRYIQTPVPDSIEKNIVNEHTLT